MPACLPPTSTVVVPPVVSEAAEVLGYGSGIGPAGGDGGDMHTSGMAAIDWLLEACPAISRPLAYTLAPIAVGASLQVARNSVTTAARSPSSSPACKRTCGPSR